MDYDPYSGVQLRALRQDPTGRISRIEMDEPLLPAIIRWLIRLFGG